MAEERIQKILARAGLGSRRSCEELISAGRVMVNGKPATLGDKADPQHDRITLDGKPVDTPEPFVYYMLYKPRNVLSTASAPDERQTVVDLVPAGERVYPVGRLDVDSEGLILLTNDGELANRLTHPRYGHEKEYRVLVARRPDPEQIETWQRGVVLEDGYRTQPADVRLESFSGKGAWLRVILREGRKRQIRETGKQIGLPVVKIIRIRIGSLQLAGLKPREWRPLSPAEVAELKGQGSKSKAGSGRAKPRSGGKAGRPPAGSKNAPRGAPKGATKGAPKGGPKGASRGGKGKPGNKQ